MSRTSKRDKTEIRIDIIPFLSNLVIMLVPLYLEAMGLITPAHAIWFIWIIIILAFIIIGLWIYNKNKKTRRIKRRANNLPILKFKINK